MNSLLLAVLLFAQTPPIVQPSPNSPDLRQHERSRHETIVTHEHHKHCAKHLGFPCTVTVTHTKKGTVRK